jgi:hypothetical protein
LRGKGKSRKQVCLGICRGRGVLKKKWKENKGGEWNRENWGYSNAVGFLEKGK